MPTVKDVLRDGTRRLVGTPAVDGMTSGRARWEAQVLLAHVLGHEDPDDLDPEAGVGAPRERRFRDLIRRRAGGEPIPHIVGAMDFRGLRLEIRPGAFVPRQSSEGLVELLVRRLRRRRRPVHVDLATGVGPVALAVAHEVPGAEVHGTDLLATGLRQARANARRLGLANVSFHRGDLYAPLPPDLRRRVDAVSIHPPYVPKDEVGDLPLEIRGYEPEEVLTDHSEHGLGLVERAAEEGLAWLRPGGWMLMEVSPDRVRAVRGVLQRAGYRDVRSLKAWPEVTRVVAGRA